jgi:RHH-type rel operon transcriptional repressor/antitoxin RelB
MLALRLKPETEARLERLAKKTGRTKSFYAREAIEENLAELELAYQALRRVKKPGKTYSAGEAKRALGL